ncbi:hypothetical protein [Enterobacter cloacae]|uniref:hypothetical protein n=1 Tax=Enterobacter cloacae TaxID=550 RepID=UPI001F512465|nr:hypothetical protein [Enterobacter cloacae]
MSSREQFEAWWEVNYHNGQPPRHGWEFWRDGEGYSIEGDEEFQWRWEAWQAATNAMEAKCAALAAKGMEVVREASLIYSKYNDTQMPDRDIVDQQTLQELYEICTADDSAAFLAEVRAQGLNAFIQHRSAELDAHIKNGGEQFDEKSVRIRDIIVSARLFREQIRKEAAQ